MITFAYCFLIISSSGPSPEELWGSLQYPSVRSPIFPSVCKRFLVIASPPRPLGGVFIVRIPKTFRSVDNHVYRQIVRQTNG